MAMHCRTLPDPPPACTLKSSDTEADFREYLMSYASTFGVDKLSAWALPSLTSQRLRAMVSSFGVEKISILSYWRIPPYLAPRLAGLLTRRRSAEAAEQVTMLSANIPVRSIRSGPSLSQHAHSPEASLGLPLDPILHVSSATP